MTGFSQGHEKGDFMIDIGFGVGVYMYDYEHTVDGTTVDQREDTAATVFWLLDAEYAVTNWLAIGGRFKNGSYLEDNEHVDNKFNSFQIGGRFYFLNRPKFLLDARLGFGTSTLKEDGRYPVGQFSFDYNTKWSGPHTSLGLGFKWMLANKVGIMFDYEFNMYRLDLKEYVVEGDSQDLNNRTWNYDVNGSELILALVIKI